MRSSENTSCIGSMAQLSQTEATNVNSLFDSFLKIGMLFCSKVHEWFVIELEINSHLRANVGIIHKGRCIEGDPEIKVIENVLKRRNLFPFF